jgi:DNA-binding GntR family transcriptional regulator
MTSGDGETIEPGVATPVWRQLTAILRARILRGQYQPGHAVPSEKQLEQEFGIARGTARKAIAALRSDGLVVTVAGRGTYVVTEAELQRYRDA